MLKLNANVIIGRVLKDFVPKNYDLVTQIGTAITPKPNFYFGMEREEAGFYIFMTATPETNNTQKEARRQILYKHKEVTAGMGMIESEAIVDDLIKELKLKAKAYNIVPIPLKYKNEFYVFSINLSIDENK